MSTARIRVSISSRKSSGLNTAKSHSKTARFATDEGDSRNEKKDITEETFKVDVLLAVRRRARLKLHEKLPNGDQIDIKPDLIKDHQLAANFETLDEKIAHNDLVLSVAKRMSTGSFSLRRSSVGVMKISVDDIVQSIENSSLKIEDQLPLPPSSSEEGASSIGMEKGKKPLHIKIQLRETEIINLYYHSSFTVTKQSEEAIQVNEDNKKYEYLTVGRGKVRRKADSEAQTTTILCKSRDVNTLNIPKQEVGSFVSNYDMFDTYKDLETITQSVSVPGEKQKLDVTTYKVGGVDQFQAISKLTSYKLAIMLTQRLLAGNVFREQQRRFRNMVMPNPLAATVSFRYRINLLWKFKPSFTGSRWAVSDISWCAKNGDILAIGYGVYLRTNAKIPKSGSVCIWSIKNPVNPERRYDYKIPVTAVEFSETIGKLLAIGFYDGTVEVRDITNDDDPPIAVSLKGVTGCELITQIKWIKQIAEENLETDPFLAISQNGSVTKFRIVNSPHLLNFRQMQLDRVEGTPEGYPVKRATKGCDSNPHPQGLGLGLHPLKNDVYYIFTDDGCLHMCSTNYSQQHLELLQVHEGSVYSMEFSPWSPKTFLTCGSDWCIRIWMESIFVPLITLQNTVGPIHCAHWSKTHATIIMSINRKTIDLWDIRRSILKPVSSVNFAKSYFTLAKFSNCGRSMVAGDQHGTAYLCSFEDMPFPPHFQYEQLEAAIFKGIASNDDLTEKVKSIGYFGNEKKNNTDFFERK